MRRWARMAAARACPARPQHRHRRGAHRAEPDDRDAVLSQPRARQRRQAREISEIITHLAFYSGWSNAMSAVSVAKDVFAAAKIGSDQLPPAHRSFSRSTRPPRRSVPRASASSSAGVPGRRAVHDRSAVPGPVAAPGPRAARPEPGHGQRADRLGSGGADPVSPQPGDGQRPDEGAGLRGAHASRLLRRLAERLLRSPGGEGRSRTWSTGRR